jgi:hypothetical protein
VDIPLPRAAVEDTLVAVAIAHPLLHAAGAVVEVRAAGVEARWQVPGVGFAISDLRFVIVD